ncbi:LysR substrate-binding domain-containing protein [Paracoccus sp. SSJ]|uniref:LysR substrate-binding domain-containing protein n=1 Tax=Paracoccus sp. SSJ TaxID=3050636 RepID=UPI0033077BD4
MTAAGMGISLLPALYVRSEVMCERLVVAWPMSSGAPVRHLSLIWRRSSPRKHTYLAVVDNLRQSLSPWGLPETG